MLQYEWRGTPGSSQMLLRLVHSIAIAIARPLSRSLLFNSRTNFSTTCELRKMGRQSFHPQAASFRLCNVSSYTTEVLEILSEDPALHVLFIPGNPGVVTFYKDFVESLYQLLGGTVSITAVGHISHSRKDWEKRSLFSLQEQIDHKMDFIKQEMLDAGVPIILVGHSIGSHISLRMLEKSPEKVLYCIGLYPFLKVNSDSFQQSIIRNLCRSSFTCAAVSLIVSSFGFLPRSASKFIISKSLGKSWSTTAIEAACSHLLNYHTVRNMLFMAMTEFEKLSEEPDWAFWEMNKRKLAFLFGTDDHWGPLQMLEEISCQVPEISLSIEREGHTHAFSCTQAGSTWVAEYVASSIKDHLSSDTFSGPRKAL